MTFEGLLKACASGKMPRIESTEPIRQSSSRKGTVTTIKHNGRYSGCGITFDSMNYELWFYSEAGTDKRKKYMSQLILLPNE